MKKLILVFSTFIFLPAAALAQQAPSETLRAPSLRVGAGGALPVSEFLATLYGPGPSVAAGLDVPISEALDVTFDASYTRLSFDDDAITEISRFALSQNDRPVEFGVTGGAHHFVSATAGVKWTFATPGRAAFYLDGGTGLYYSTVGDFDIVARDAQGNVVGEGSGTVYGGDGTSFGFRLGAGVRLPLAAGVDFFLEPRYALVLEDTQYFSTRAGVSFDGLFDASPVSLGEQQVSAPAPRRYEVSTSYRGTFFGDGDETGAAYRAKVARRLFSDRTGLALAGAYRRAVDTDLQQGLNWKKRRGAAADLTFFVDALQFETGAATHRLRVGAGPAVRRQWGEAPRSIRTGTPGHPLNVERWLEVEENDRARRIPTEGENTRYLFTEAFGETQWGGAFKLEYVLAFDNITVGPSLGYWYYGEGSPAMSYGVQVGVPFGALLD